MLNKSILFYFVKRHNISLLGFFLRGSLPLYGHGSNRRRTRCEKGEKVEFSGEELAS